MRPALETLGEERNSEEVKQTHRLTHTVKLKGTYNSLAETQTGFYSSFMPLPLKKKKKNLAGSKETERFTEDQKTNYKISKLTLIQEMNWGRKNVKKVPQRVQLEDVV